LHFIPFFMLITDVTGSQILPALYLAIYRFPEIEFQMAAERR